VEAVAALGDAREERQIRRARAADLRLVHPCTRWLAHVLDDRAHRRTGDGSLACGEPSGALVAAPDGTPACPACFP
jgi:hypothetical protein